MRLNELKRNQTAIIKKIKYNYKIKQNFVLLTPFIDKEISFLFSSPFCKNKVFLINNTLLSIPDDFATNVIVE